MSKLVRMSVATLVLTFAACKSEERRETTAPAPTPAPAAEPVPQAAVVKHDAGKVAAASEVKLGPNERFWGEGDRDNVVAWGPAAAKEPVTLYVVRIGEHQGVLRADHGGRTRDIEKFTLAS